MIKSSTLSAGDVVRVRSKDEILATLDERGQLDGLPFMPEMLSFCGREFTVSARAHKTCDPPNGLKGRRMLNAVHLDNVRCNGEAHGGCQAQCLMFWKDAWLEKVSHGDRTSLDSGASPSAPPSSRCTEQCVWNGTRDQARETDAEPVFACQSTQIPAATLPLESWDLRQYVEDVTSGNVGVGRVVGSFVAFLCQQIANAGLGLGTPVRLAYDGIQQLRHGVPYPWRTGLIAEGEKTPAGSLQLQPGEYVRVKRYEEILATINEQGNNRGMSFDAEMVPYCGGTYRVLARIDRIINEKTGRMQSMKTPCIILDNVICTACYAENRRFCPRAIFPYWREIWLERAEPSKSGGIDAPLTWRGGSVDHTAMN